MLKLSENCQGVWSSRLEIVMPRKHNLWHCNRSKHNQSFVSFVNLSSFQVAQINQKHSLGDHVQLNAS